MKKSKLLVLGLIALMLVGGLVLASCGFPCGGPVGGGECGKNQVSCSDRCFGKTTDGGGDLPCADACK